MTCDLALANLLKQEKAIKYSLEQAETKKGRASEKAILMSDLKKVESAIANLRAYSAIAQGMTVKHKNRFEKKPGVIIQLIETPGGMGQAWVSWGGRTPVPEQPELLIIQN